MFKFLAILHLSLFFTCLSHAGEPSDSFSVGIVSSDSLGFLVSTTEKSLRDDVVLICSPIKRVCEPVLSKFFINEKKNEAVEDVATEKSIYTYRTTNLRSEEGINIAIIYPKNNTGKLNVKIDENHNISIKNNNIKTVISYCTSNEGIHIYSNTKNTHLYYSLGYEIKANCSEEIYK